MDGKWWTHNDDQPKKQISKKRLVTDDNYIYLYEKKKILQEKQSFKIPRVESYKKRKLEQDEPQQNKDNKRFRSSEPDMYDLNVCRGCNKTLKQLKNHLLKSKLDCASLYNMDKLNRQLKTKRTSYKTEQRRRIRGNLPEEKQKLIQKKDTSSRRTARDNLSPEKQKLIQKKETSSRKAARDNLSPDQRNEIRSKDKTAREEARKRLRADPFYKQSHAAKIADYRRRKAYGLNSTIQGRK